MLSGIGANVYCEARKNVDLAWIKAYGYNPIHLNDLEKHLNKFDIIIEYFISRGNYNIFEIKDERRIMVMKRFIIGMQKMIQREPLFKIKTMSFLVASAGK